MQQGGVCREHDGGEQTRSSYYRAFFSEEDIEEFSAPRRAPIEVDEQKARSSQKEVEDTERHY